MLNQCLGGVRVLDLSQYLPGPYGAQILADLGAEVVKVEPPAGDPMRALGPLDGDGISAFYKLVNAGKTVLWIDLKSETGQATFRALLGRADALVESFRPGALDKLGFGPAALKALNPRLVHTALSGYGQTGPYAARAGHDLNYMALAGGLATSGTAERPVMAHPPAADFAGGMQAALVTLAGLMRRQQTGGGGFFDVSIAETVMGWQALALTAAHRPGFEPRRGAALLNGGAACYQLYATADRRFVTLGALEPKFWAAFCRAMGRADWTARQDEALPQTALIGEVSGLLASRTLAHWQELLDGVDCCFQPVVDPGDLPEDPQIRARGLVTGPAAPDPLVEVLFPAFLDGDSPTPRPAVREAEPDAVLRAWQSD